MHEGGSRVASYTWMADKLKISSVKIFRYIVGALDRH